MKKRLLTVAFLMGAWGAYSQVGIGTTTPNKSSQLEVVAKDKGILIPQVPLKNSTDKTTITHGNITSLLVWNTNTIADITPGYYYWFENKWMRIVDTDTLASLDSNTKNTSLTVQGDQLVLTDSDGNKVSIPLSEVNIPTTMVKNPDGTYTYTNEKDVTIIIDATDNVINNFENIVNNTDVLNELIKVLGDTYVGGNVYFDGDTFTYVTENGETKEINFNEIVKANETLTVLSYNDTTNILTYKDEKGKDKIIDLNIGSISYNAVENRITYIDGNGTSTPLNLNETSLVYDKTTKTLVYTDSKGVAHPIDLGALVAAHESITTLINNGDGTYTYTSENKTVTVIDIPSSVVENFETIVNEGPITINGNTFDTIEEYITYIANTSVTIGGSDFIDVSGTGTSTDPYKVSIKEGTADSMLITNAAGELEWATIENIVKGNETVTTITDNGDGTYTYTNEAKKEVTIDVPTSVVKQFQEIINNGGVQNILNDYIINNVGGNVSYDGNDFYYVDNSGNLVKIDIIGDVVNNITNKGDIYDEIVNIIKAKSDVLVDLGNGKFEHTAADGKVVEFDVNTVNVEKVTDADGNISYIFKDADGTAITTIDATQDVVNNIVNEGAIYDEIINILKAESDILEDLGNGKYKHTAADGKVVEFDVNTVNVEKVTDADGNISYVFKDADGTAITTIDATQDVVNNIVNEGAIYDEIINILKAESDILEDLGNGKYKHTAADGKVVEFDVNTVNVEKVTDADGNISYIFKDADGTAITTIDATQDVVNNIVNEGAIYDEIVKVIELNETVTNLVENTDGTFTYYNEEAYAADGTLKPGAIGTIIDPSLVNVTKVDNKYVFKNNNGDVIAELEYNAGDIVYNDNTTNLGATNVQEAIEKLLTKITEVENTKGDLSLEVDVLEFLDGSTGTDKLLADAKIGIADGGITTDKIADGAVTNDKVGADAITSDKIKDGEVKTADLADGSVTSEKLIATSAEEGKVGVVQADGTVVYQNVSSDNIDGKDLTAADGSIVVTDGLGATLVDANVKVADGGITTDKLADGAVTNDKVGADAITTDKIKDGEVKTADLADGSVTSEKLIATPAEEGKVGVVQADGTVVYQNVSSDNIDGKDLTAADGSIVVTDGLGATLVDAKIGIADGGITTDKLADGAVTNDKVGADAITTDKIADGAVTNDKVGADAITSDKIKDGEVKTADLADGSVTSEKLIATPAEEGKVGVVQPDGTVVYQNVSSDNIDGKDLTAADGSIVVTDGLGATLVDANVKVADGGITTDKIADGAVTNDKVGADAITTDKLADGAVTNDKVGADAITTDKIADGAVTNDKVGADAITSDKIKDGEVKTADLADGSVTSEKLIATPAEEGKVGVVQADGTVVYQNVSSDNIDGKDLTAADGSIVVTDGLGATLVDANVKVADGGITTDKLADGAVTPEKIGAGGAGEILITDTDGTVKWVDSSHNLITDLVKSNETVTTLLDNGDGTFTYYNESDYATDGTLNPGATGVVFDANTMRISEASGVYTFTDAKGSILAEIDTNAGAIIFNDTVTQLGADSVQTAIEKLLEKINTIENTTGDLTGDGILVSDGGSSILKDVILSIADGAISTDKLADRAVTNDKVGADAITSDKIKDGEVKTSDLADGSVTSEKLIATPAEEGKVGVVQADGTVVYQNVSSDNIDGKDLTAADGSIVVTDGLGATLVDANVKVADGGITTDKLADGAVTNDKVGADAITSDKIKDGEVKTSDLADGSVTSEKLIATPAEEGKVGVVQADGTVVYQNVSSDNIDGKDLTAADGSIVVTDGLGATLVDANVKVADGGITTDKLADGAVTNVKVGDDAITSDKIADGTIKPEDIANAGNNQVLVTDASGVPIWMDQKSIDEGVTADNGLTIIAKNIQLGGELIEPTVIIADSTNTLAVEGLQNGDYTDNIVVANPTSGVLKQIKATMPKFFYMPSMVLPTAADQIVLSMHASESGGTFTIDLHAVYAEQFGGTNNATSTSNAGKITSLPVLPKSELDYYITFFDNTVYENVSVNNEGILTYTISISADPTIGSFMNIAFAVRP